MRKIEVLNIKDNIRETGVEDIQNCIDDVKILTNVQMAKKEDKEKTVMDDMAEGEIVERIKEDQEILTNKIIQGNNTEDVRIIPDKVPISITGNLRGKSQENLKTQENNSKAWYEITKVAIPNA